MFKSFFFSKDYAFFAWGVLLILVLLSVGQVYLTVQFNDWYKLFYDTLQNLDYDQFSSLLIRFSWLAAIAILTATAAFYIAQHWTFRWRQALTYNYLPRWKNLKSEKYEGSSQRIQEDTMRFASTVHGLGLGALKAVMTLIAFIPILWGLSESILIFGYSIIGNLVWIAFGVSIGGMLISWWMGRKLPKLEYENQKVEAAFRKRLVYAEDNKAYADIPTLKELFIGVRTNYFRLFNQFKWFTLWQNFYYQAGAILPFLITAPSFFTGLITLGVLVQVSNAFDKVHSSFSFFLENWITVNELRAIVMRLKEFEAALNKEENVSHNI